MILKLKHRSTMNLLWTFLSLTAAFALTSSIVVAQQPENV
jgi:hypothetical protein